MYGTQTMYQLTSVSCGVEQRFVKVPSDFGGHIGAPQIATLPHDVLQRIKRYLLQSLSWRYVYPVLPGRFSSLVCKIKYVWAILPSLSLSTMLYSPIFTSGISEFHDVLPRSSRLFKLENSSLKPWSYLSLFGCYPVLRTTEHSEQCDFSFLHK